MPRYTGRLNTSGVNLIEDGFRLSGFPRDTDPMLDDLASNGGPKKTHTLVAGSLAIDAGDNAICAAASAARRTRR